MSKDASIHFITLLRSLLKNWLQKCQTMKRLEEILYQFKSLGLPLSTVCYVLLNLKQTCLSSEETFYVNNFMFRYAKNLCNFNLSTWKLSILHTVNRNSMQYIGIFHNRVTLHPSFSFGTQNELIYWCLSAQYNLRQDSRILPCKVDDI